MVRFKIGTAKTPKYSENTQVQTEYTRLEARNMNKGGERVGLGAAAHGKRRIEAAKMR